MHHDDAVEELLALLDWVYSDEVDWFEDELAHRLGIEKGPGCSYEEWRKLRVRAIHACGAAADRAATAVEGPKRPQLVDSAS